VERKKFIVFLLIVTTLEMAFHGDRYFNGVFRSADARSVSKTIHNHESACAINSLEPAYTFELLRSMQMTHFQTPIDWLLNDMTVG